MDYQIKIERAWPYRHPKHGRSQLAPGTYSVPEQVSDAVAQRAIGQGVARKIVVVPLPQAAKPTRRGTRKAKGPAPQNRALPVAPENKQAVH